MKVMVLGGRGMAGHILVDWLRAQSTYEVWSTHRTMDPTDPHVVVLDATDEVRLRTAVERLRPDIVINCVGILNQFADQDPVSAIMVNSLLPHRLRILGDIYGFRLIHISTDCVFSGSTGRYEESAPKDGQGLYAQTKSVGEITAPPHLTIRTSIIGPELKPDGIGLFHWFMHSQGVVQGFTHVYWNGVTTLELAKFVNDSIVNPKSGLVHLCSPTPISKYALLGEIKKEFVKDNVTLVPTERPVQDKTLCNTRPDITWSVPSYATMIRHLHDWMLDHPKERYQYAL